MLPYHNRNVTSRYTRYNPHYSLLHFGPISICLPILIISIWLAGNFRISPLLRSFAIKS